MIGGTAPGYYYLWSPLLGVLVGGLCTTKGTVGSNEIPTCALVIVIIYSDRFSCVLVLYPIDNTFT